MCGSTAPLSRTAGVTVTAIYTSSQPKVPEVAQFLVLHLRLLQNFVTVLDHFSDTTHITCYLCRNCRKKINQFHNPDAKTEK